MEYQKVGHSLREWHLPRTSNGWAPLAERVADFTNRSARTTQSVTQLRPSA
ncbi:hypothetical protein FTUN_4391 [Frigoriglobus tundricola]|uniref:Uncharacterized protein n=1 Tax=Frigoriglobus tundricola TaxID=2774151 RepID=A0A6M5YUB0_9BACT|nr:hypothetical protein FTUN_4391 [Frigoriglobus tundricola]